MQLALVALSSRALALLSTDRDAFEREAGIALDDGWPGSDLAEALGHIAAASSDEAPLIFAIVDRSRARDGRPRIVGDAGFHGPPSAEGDVEIGYAVLAHERRRGVATWAIGALLPIARARDGVRRLVARCAPDNAGSIGALRAQRFERLEDAEGLERWART